MLPLLDRFASNESCVVDVFRIVKVVNTDENEFDTHPFSINEDGFLVGTIPNNMGVLQLFIEGSSGVKWGGGDDYLVEITYVPDAPIMLSGAMSVLFNISLPVQEAIVLKPIVIGVPLETQFTTD